MATRDETLSMIARLREEIAALYRAKGGAPADATATPGLQTINTPAMNMRRHTAPPASMAPIAAQIAQKEAILLQLSDGLQQGLQQGLRLAEPPTGSPGVVPDIGGPVSDQLPPPGGEPTYPATVPTPADTLEAIEGALAQGGPDFSDSSLVGGEGPMQLGDPAVDKILRENNIRSGHELGVFMHGLRGDPASGITPVFSSLSKPQHRGGGWAFWPRGLGGPPAGESADRLPPSG